MEKLKAIFGTIFGAIILALIIWIILFFTVPKVKTWTKEKIFNQPKQEQTETKEEDVEEDDKDSLVDEDKIYKD